MKYFICSLVLLLGFLEGVFFFTYPPSDLLPISKGEISCITDSNRVFKAKVDTNARLSKSFHSIINKFKLKGCQEKHLELIIPDSYQSSNRDKLYLYIPYTRGVNGVSIQGKTVSFEEFFQIPDALKIPLMEYAVKAESTVKLSFKTDPRITIRLGQMFPVIGNAESLRGYHAINLFRFKVLHLFIIILGLIFGTFFLRVYFKKRKEFNFLIVSSGFFLTASVAFFGLNSFWQTHPVLMSSFNYALTVLHGLSLFLFIYSFYFIRVRKTSYDDIKKTWVFRSIALFIVAFFVAPVAHYLGFPTLGVYLIALTGVSLGILFIWPTPENLLDKLNYIIAWGVGGIFVMTFAQNAGFVSNRYDLIYGLVFITCLILVLSMIYFLGYFNRLVELEALQLVYEEKLKTVEMTMKIIRHDISQPFDFIQSSFRQFVKKAKFERTESAMSMMKNMFEKTEAERKYVMDIVDSAKQFYENQEIQKEWFNPKDLFDLKDLAFLSDRYEEIPKFNFNCSVEKIYADRRKVLRVIRNLTKNALSITQGKTEIDFGVFEDQDKYTFVVENTGSQIPDQIMGNLFEPSVSFRNSTGLGLYIARTMVGSHAGSIHAENLENSVRITFTLKKHH